MNTLSIDGKDYTVKFDYYFYDRLINKFAKGKDKDSNNQIDGFSRLIEGLVAEDPDAVVLAYQEAIVGKTRPSKGQVAQALDDAGIWESKDPFGDVYKEIRSAGFLKLKIRALVHLLKNDAETAEAALEVMKETSDNSKDGKQAVKEAENQVALSKKQVELTKKFLEQLAN